MHHTVEHGHIAAKTLGHGDIGKTGQLDISGIGHNQLGPFFLGPEDTPGNQRMTRGCVRTCDKDTGRILNFGDGIGHGATSKCCGQTDHSGRMSEPGTVIHIVGPDHCSGKFLNQVIFFIGNFSGSQYTDAIRAVGLNNGL